MSTGTPRAALCTMIALCALAIAPAAASAVECSIDDTPGPAPSLLDPQGYEWDISDDNKSAPAIDNSDDFATLYNGGGKTTTSPAAPRNGSDSYDGFGALFVGPGAGGSLANQYFSADDNSCVFEDGGRTLAFPALPLTGLTVQRKLFVGAAGLPGARVINLVTNRSSAAITTSVQIGDLNSLDDLGDLGSDNATGVRSSSTSDAQLTTADHWFVTNDTVGPINGDPALAHVMDGFGAAERVDFVTVGTGTDSAPEDNTAWRWDNVAVQPGQTRALVSVEIQQMVAGASAPVENMNAGEEAVNYLNGFTSQTFPSMDKTELAQLANWLNPVKCRGRAVTMGGSDLRDVIVGTPKADVIWAGAGNDKVLGKKGNDRICGGPGKDKLIGGAGPRDRLKGGGGRDIERP